MSRFAKIRWEIVYIYCTEFLDLQKIEYPKLRKFNGKLCTLYTYETSAFAEKLNVQYCGNSTGNSVRYMYGMSKFAKNLNIPNSENSTGNCVHYLCTEIGRAHV